MSSSTPYRVLFVCLGNICRSPAAEIVCRAALAEAHLQDSVAVDSCGTASYHVGSKPDARMLAALQRAGYAYLGHRARALSRSDGDRFDLIVPQDDDNYSDILDTLGRQFSARVVPMSYWFPPEAADCYKSVPDPYYGTDDDFDDVVALLRASMPALIDFIRQARLA